MLVPATNLAFRKTPLDSEGTSQMGRVKGRERARGGKACVLLLEWHWIHGCGGWIGAPELQHPQGMNVCLVSNVFVGCLFCIWSGIPLGGILAGWIESTLPFIVHMAERIAGEQYSYDASGVPPTQRSRGLAVTLRQFPGASQRVTWTVTPHMAYDHF